MLNKIKLFLQKHMIIIFLILFGIVVALVTVLSFALRTKPMTKLVDKTNAIINKATDKITDINTQKAEIDITKKIELQQNNQDKLNFVNKLQIISAIPDRKEKMKRMIELNNSIKVPND